MKAKRLLAVFAAFALSATMLAVGCNEGGGSGAGTDGGEGGGEKPTIYLAGDSTVQTYEDAQYIAGWGQYLGDFLDGITVKNAAKGGRSSRSFINEGRLFAGDEYKYSFKENDGNSIEECIKEGDYLFIQFGHNDDDTKEGDTMADRMVPLGDPDSNGVYPVTAPTGKQSTTYIPADYKTKFPAKVAEKETEIKKYGDEYYAYDCGGTYKWFLKQYIDLAREYKATPVLVTSVARVKFDNSGNIIGGPGLHGPDFAYVKAARQLAKEEDCLLIDLFSETKTMLETATKTYADFLMALVPNPLTGTWPTDYDKTYNNPAAGFEKIEATHYNKYGAYLTAAKVAENILASAAAEESHNSGKESFAFADCVKTVPSKYVDPSNLISKTKAAELEGLFTTVNPTNPARVYPNPAAVKSAITELVATAVTAENYEAQTTAYQTVLAAYYNLNIDDRAAVDNFSALETYGASLLNAKIAALLTGTVDGTNYKTYDALCKQLREEYSALSSSVKSGVTNITLLEQYEQAVKDNMPKPKKVVIFDPSTITDANLTAAKSYSYNVIYGAGAEQTGNTGETVDFKIAAASGKAVDIKSSTQSFNYNGQNYSVSKGVSLGGGATFGEGGNRYVEFTTTAACKITVAAMSTSTDPRTMKMVKASDKSDVASFSIPGTLTVVSYDLTTAGAFQIGSASSGLWIYSIIIEYFE